MGLGDFRFGTGALGGQAEGQSFNHPYQRLGFYGALGLGLGDFRFGTGALGEQAEGQSFNHPYQRLGLYGALGLGLGDFRYQRLEFYGPLGLGLGDFRFGTGALGGQAASITCQQMSHCCCLPRTVTLPCTSHPEPRSNATRCPNRLPPNVTLVLRLPRNVTLQRTQSRSNATRMLQSPATKCHTGAAPATQRQSPATTCHTGAAPATQRHTATYHSLHQPPQSHAATGSVTCTSDPISRVQASQFHVHKRTRALLNSSRHFRD